MFSSMAVRDEGLIRIRARLFSVGGGMEVYGIQVSEKEKKWANTHCRLERH